MKDTIALIAATCFQPIADALNRIADALGNKPNGVTGTPAPTTTIEAAPVIEATPEPQPKRTRGPNKPKPAEIPAPAPASEGTAQAEGTDGDGQTDDGELNGEFEHDFGVIQTYVTPLLKAGRKTAILDQLKAMGAARVAELPPAKFPELLAFLKQLGEETV